MFNLYLPSWITLATIEYYSEAMWAHLMKCESVPLANFRQEWDMSITFLYGALPGLVFVSKQYPGNLAELGFVCAENGHVPVYDDAVLTPEGVFERCLVVPAIDALIKRSASARKQRERALQTVASADSPHRKAWRKRLGFEC